MQLLAYNLKTRTPNVPVLDAVITKNSKGRYLAQGHDGNGNKLSVALSEEKALAAIEAGVAKKGWEDGYQQWLTQVKKEQNHYPLFKGRDLNENNLMDLFKAGKTPIDALNDLSEAT